MSGFFMLIDLAVTYGLIIAGSYYAMNGDHQRAIEVYCFVIAFEIFSIRRALKGTR